MANNPTKADLKAAAAYVREEDLEELEELKKDLLARVDKARDDGRLYMMSQYTRLIALVSPEIKRIRDRFDREILASVRKEYKALKGEHDGEASDNES
jgi:hypothetical protein